jgi:hypothetical protein
MRSTQKIPEQGAQASLGGASCHGKNQRVEVCMAGEDLISPLAVVAQAEAERE